MMVWAALASPLAHSAPKNALTLFSKHTSELFNYIDIPVKDIHGKQKQQKRTATFFEFCQVG